MTFVGVAFDKDRGRNSNQRAMWPEALPPLMIIAACISFTGWALGRLDRWETGGKVGYYCTSYRSYDVTQMRLLLYSAAKVRFGQVGSHYDRKRQANHWISTQAEGNPASTHLKYKNRIKCHQIILSCVSVCGLIMLGTL